MASWGEFSKRLIFGRPLHSQMLGDTLLPKTLALPVFSSDALSSVAYATQEILLVLSIGGVAFLYLAPWVAVAVAVLMVTVVFSYRRTVHAYPSGGGDYEVATVNFGKRAGMLVAAALMVDYVVTVAVSVSAGVDAITSAATDPKTGLSWLSPYGVRIALGMLLIITLLNLRGVRESGTAFAIPTYAFIVTVLALIGIGVFRLVGGHLPAAPTAGRAYEHPTSYAGLALVWLAIRAFASGCTALTGVEAIANGVPAFRKPKSKNAAQTLLMMGVMSLVMFGGITMLALKTHVHYAEDERGQPIGGTVMSQIGETVFGGKHNLAYLMLQITTALILSLAANTAFNGFPVLASVLAQNRLLPRQLHTRGDRLVFSNGIIMLALFAGLLIWGFNAHTSELINLYIIGVFIAFTASQFGMVRHWTRHLREDDPSPAEARVMRTSRSIQLFGGSLTGVILVLELFTKFVAGAWISVSGIVLFYLVMRAINNHYEHVAKELAPTDAEVILPSRNHAIVLVSKIHKPTLRALAYAYATRPSTLVGLTVKVDGEELDTLQHDWEQRGIDVPLVVVDSPYREITQPIIKYIKEIRRDSPRDVVTVYIPEYVVGRWWEQLLHNQSALRLKARLLFEPGIMVTSVPWQLRSSQAVIERVGADVPIEPADRA